MSPEVGVRSGQENLNGTGREAASPTLHAGDHRAKNSHLFTPISAVSVLPSRHWYVRCKRGVEFFLALVLCVPATPLILLAALLVKLTSRGPAIYTQTRLGLNSKPFILYKIRTMFHNCEQMSGVRWSTPNDPRITWVGRFLRRTHLDELPQLWNVLRGDMSLVGPRPERPEFTPALEKAIPGYRERLRVRPGVTGLAQVQLPSDTDLASVCMKLSYDLYYIRHLSLWLDLRLLLCTVVHIFGVPYHVVGRWFVMPTRAAVEHSLLTPVAEGAPG